MSPAVIPTYHGYNILLYVWNFSTIEKRIDPKNDDVSLYIQLRSCLQLDEHLATIGNTHPTKLSCYFDALDLKALVVCTKLHWLSFLNVQSVMLCLLIHLAEKVCAPPLTNLFSVSKGLLDLPAPSLFLWLGRRNGIIYPNSSGNHLQLPFSKQNSKPTSSVSLVIKPLLFCFSLLSRFVVVLFIVQRFDLC